MNIDNINKGIQYVSVKDMNLEQFVSFCIAQYKGLPLRFSLWERRLEYNNVTLEEFINSVCLNASGKDLILFEKYSNASLPKAKELVEYEFSDFYPFKDNEFIFNLSDYIDEQQNRHRPHHVPEYLPLNTIDFSSYIFDNNDVIEGTELIECFYYPDLQRYVYQVSIPCSVCQKERIHTLRMTLEEYKKVVNYHTRVVNRAQEEIDKNEKWKYKKDRIYKALEQRLRIPDTSNFYIPKTLFNKDISITFIQKNTKEVICTSSGKIKGVRPQTREDFAYKMPNGFIINAYHLAIYLKGIMFQGEEVKALMDIRPLGVIQEDLDICTPWFMSLEEPYECVHPYSFQLVDPYPGVLCLLKIKEDEII
jgi:hypothetical protein